MANKIITIAADAERKDANLLVFADLNIDASQAKIQFKDIDYPQQGFLKNEDSDEGYVLQDPSTQQGRIIIQTEKSTAKQDSQYNIDQNKRAKYKLDKNVNVIAVKNSIHNIFTWIPGERILNPEFGSNLRSYLYEGLTDFNQDKIMAEIQHCFQTWEPRAVVQSVVKKTAVNDVENNTVILDIIYSIPELSDEQFHYTYEVTQNE